MKKLTAYKCDHCGKFYQREKMCERHEKACNKNAENWRACSGCKFLSKKRVTTIKGEKDLFFCSKKDIFLHPPKSEHKGNVFDLGDTPNLPMPKECEFFQYDDPPF